MATIKYNGMELEEFTRKQVFNPPVLCVVWDDKLSPYEDLVLAITADEKNPVVTYSHVFREHCALLPEKPAPRRATNRELSKWIASKGEYKYIDSTSVCSGYSYPDGRENDFPSNSLLVRKWSDKEWHTPDVEYMGIEEDK